MLAQTGLANGANISKMSAQNRQGETFAHVNKVKDDGEYIALCDRPFWRPQCFQFELGAEPQQLHIRHRCCEARQARQRQWRNHPRTRAQLDARM